MGHIYQRGRIWWVKYSHQGHVRRESSKSKVYAKAKKLLAIREGKLSEGHPLLPQHKTGQDAFELVKADYLENGRKSLAHIERYWDLHLEPVFGRRKLEVIRSAELRAYRTSRHQAGASKATINREVALMSRMLTLAAEQGWIVARPPIPRTQEDNARKGFFEPEAYASVQQHLRRPTLRSLLTLAYWTGWRTKAELLTLTWSQVDRARMTIRLEPGTTKNREGRLFPYGDLSQVVYAIDELWREREARQAQGLVCPWVFTRVRVNRPLKQSRVERIKSFRKVWKRAARDAGCPGRIPHDFRRTAVRNLVRAGVNEKVAMQLTGHKTRSVFDRYDIVIEKDLQEAVSRYSGSQEKRHGRHSQSDS